MENGLQQKWQFRGNEELNMAAISIREALAMLMKNVNNPDVLTPSQMPYSPSCSTLIVRRAVSLRQEATREW
ncbi:putative aminotransferase TAT2 [Prunus yedoensis var. nudiflora]|uniref:Putative aminotransferase TAT2 n=1 Tax=Prunus yedoensis var. nudiflora TaxID=2094558 RepID=A0A314XY78_PRUYE|nr:putative aminotransferase TAT2 [Prunus yedoensis var. nudiflora]